MRLPPSRRFAAGWIAPVALIIAGLFFYASTFRLHFFWEDPFDIGQVETHSFIELLTAPVSNAYYRPLTLAVFKLLRESPLGTDPMLYRVLIVGAHIAAACLLLGLARKLFRDARPALAAAGLFLFYPPSYEAVARAASHHPLLMLVTIGALWAWLSGREDNRPRLIGLALGLATAAPFFQENGVLLSLMLIALEAFLVRTRRVARFKRMVLWTLAPALLFGLIWLSIPKTSIDAAPTLWPGGAEFAYMSQSLSYPFAGIIAMLTPGPAPQIAQATLALALTLALLLSAYGCASSSTRGSLPVFALLLSWWLIAISLAWLTRSIAYLEVSPRVMYFASLPAALTWGGLLLATRTSPRAERFLRAALVLTLTIHSAVTLQRSMTLYTAGSDLMRQIVDARRDDPNGGRELYVNVPDRLAHKQPLYPVGYWGMLLAPVSQDLSAFVRFSTGRVIETRSLTARPLADADIAASPFEIATRGVEAYDSEKLYDAARWAGQTYVVRYAANGSMTLEAVGEIASPRGWKANAGAISGRADVLAASGSQDGNALEVTVAWRAWLPVAPTDTIFVHVIDASGGLVAQSDGDSLDGLIRPSAWRNGDAVTDRRVIQLDKPLSPGVYRIYTGMYSRIDGKRLPAVDATGRPVPNDAIPVAEVQIKGMP
jgi:hypothetical protein